MTLPPPVYHPNRLASLSESATNALVAIATNDFPADQEGPTPHAICWLFLTIVGERPACHLTYRYDSTRHTAAVSNPFDNVLVETPLHHSIKRISYTAPRPDETVCTLVAAQDPRFVYWQAHGYLSPVEYGRELGYPEEAVAAFEREETILPNSDEFAELRREADLPASAVRYADLVPYVPPATVEGVREIVARGERYEIMCRTIAARFSEYSALSERVDDVLNGRVA